MKQVFFIPFLLAISCAYKVKPYSQNILEIIFDLKVDPDTRRNVSELISSKGYPVENYDVQTADGFILSIQRIPHGKKNGKMSLKKDVVFLQHGLLSSSTDFVINSANESLGFILADAGYDVWLGNVRGNTYSRRHIKYTPNMKEFWAFSFDEMAKYDLPAMIDFVLNKTSKEQLFFIGHSQGTTVGFALLSERPDFNKKIRVMIALAPVATVGYISSPIRYLAPFTTEEEFIFKLFGINEFLPNNQVMKFLSKFVCSSRIKVICEDIAFIICGTDMSQLNETRLGVYVAHTPAGTSTKSIIHYAQMVVSKTFQKYDYGSIKNMAVYNQATPPKYHVENITAPVALFWSKNDKLADPVDVGMLEKKLTNVIATICIKDPLFNHLDFIWGINASTFVYADVISILRKYSF